MCFLAMFLGIRGQSMHHNYTLVHIPKPYLFGITAEWLLFSLDLMKIQLC